MKVDNPSVGAVTATSITGLTTPLSIGQGGTGQVLAANALNALLPSQTGNGTKFLQTDGSNASWQTASGGSLVTSRQETFTYAGSPIVLAATPSAVQGVYINGIILPTANWSLSTATITFSGGVVTNDNINVIYFPSAVGSYTFIQQDFSGAGSTDLTLTHTPQFVCGVFRGSLLPTTEWSIISSTTLRLATALLTGDTCSITYFY